MNPNNACIGHVEADQENLMDQMIITNWGKEN